MVEKRKVREGYKKTEVGVIPEDWEVLPFNKYLDIFSGKGFNKSEYSKMGIKLLRIDNVSYGKITWNSIAYLPYSYKDIYPSLYLNEGDILLALNRPITNNKLKLARLESNDVPSILYQRVGKIVWKSESVDNNFIFHILNKYIKEFVEQTSVGSDQPFISTTNLKKMKMVFPPLKEQNLIAKALTDTDNLIQSIEKLIDKKEKIKKGTMQELLTGKKRLDGFSGEWEIKSLGDISDIRTGKKDNENKEKDGIYPFFVRSQHIERINSYSYDGEAILIPGEGRIGSIYHYINGKFDYHQRVYKISDFKGIEGKYVYYFMKQTFNEHAMRNSVKATVDSLRLPTFQEFEIYCPSSLKEQKAIAQILSDMDQEIETLKEKLEKYKTIKQAMMQELLTGRIRLI